MSSKHSQVWNWILQLTSGDYIKIADQMVDNAGWGWILRSPAITATAGFCPDPTGSLMRSYVCRQRQRWHTESRTSFPVGYDLSHPSYQAEDTTSLVQILFPGHSSGLNRTLPPAERPPLFHRPVVCRRAVVVAEERRIFFASSR